MKPLTIIRPKMSAKVKGYDIGATKWIYFLIEDEELLKLVSAIFKQIFIFHQMIAIQKL